MSQNKFHMDGWSEEEIRERQQADMDEHYADIAYEKARRYHFVNHVDDSESDPDCKFCKEEGE